MVTICGLPFPTIEAQPFNARKLDNTTDKTEKELKNLFMS
jgi:hypothetical protein